MSVQPFPNPKFQEFDSNGDPLSGGLLYTYSAGTTTPLATYTTRAGTIANANPVVLDSNGRADVWLTPGVSYKFELRNSAGVVQWTVDNIPSPSEVTTTLDSATYPGGRLTLTSGTPVTTSNVSGATTVHYVPYLTTKVPLYDGTSWALYDIGSGLSQTTADNTKSPTAVGINSTYDVYVWSDSGTLRATRGPAWTTGSGASATRGTGAGTSEIERVNGRYVNKYSISNGPAAQRGLYVGTIRSDGSSQINDTGDGSGGTVPKRHVWNAYNRVRRSMLLNGEASGVGNYNYTTAIYRQANANTGNQMELVQGLAGDAVEAHVYTAFYNTNANVRAEVSIGLDSTNTPATGVLGAGRLSQVANIINNAEAHWCGYPGIGQHTLAWLEYSAATGTTTWQVQTAGPVGMNGSVWA